ASRNYYCEFLAILYAVSYREFSYGLPPMTLRPESAVQFTRLEKPMRPAQIAKAMRISLAEFRSLNPDISNLSQPIPRGVSIALPARQDDLSTLAKSNRKAARAKSVRRKHVSPAIS